ncbi:MAG: Asp-tRNA(Asn)/Glu-tRNA(Gln) amidotransferase subunit GatC [Candidatus Peribacteraceae bacterium]
MTTLTRDQILHIAKLARLTLTDEEIEKMPKELSSILSYVDMLGEVNTDGVEPTAQVTGIETRLREDTVTQSDASSAELLACSPLPITEHQITTPHAHG